MTNDSSRSLRVAIVTYAMNVGGNETAILLLARYLRERGDRVTVVTTEVPGQWFDRALTVGASSTHIGPADTSSPGAPIAHARRLARFLSEFDVVFFFHARIAQAALGSLPDKIVAISVIQLDAPQLYDIGLMGASGLNAVVAVSPKVARIAQHVSGGRVPVVTIPNSTVVPETVATRPDPGSHGLRIVVAARLEPVKGIEWIAPTLRGLVERGVDASVVVLGGGGERQALVQALGAAGVASRADVRGAVSPEEVRREMARAHALFLPSKAEGLPLVLVEAMAEGCVPVVSRLPGITDAVIDEGANGLLFPVGDTAAMADCLAQLAGDPAGWRRMSDGAHKIARDRYSYEAMGQAYTRLLDDARAGRLPLRRTRRLLLPVNPLFLYSWTHLIPAPVRDFVRARRRAWAGSRSS